MRDLLKTKISQLRDKYVKQDLVEKEERRRLREQRDYEIFDQMPYKFNTKVFSMKERHPVSKMRFESAAKLIQQQ